MLLADDHRQTAEQLRALLQHHFDVVGLVADGHALVRAALELSPDVIVTDISMPGLDGIDAVALIRRRAPEVRIVLITVHGERILVERGLAAGALGYVLKDTAGDDLVPAVIAALAGQQYVSRVLGGCSDDTNDGSIPEA